MLGGYLFAVEGWGSDKELIERYDPNTDTWEPIEGDRCRTFHIHRLVVALDGELYFIGMEQIDATVGSACWVS